MAASATMTKTANTIQAYFSTSCTIPQRWNSAAEDPPSIRTAPSSRRTSLCLPNSDPPPVFSRLTIVRTRFRMSTNSRRMKPVAMSPSRCTPEEYPISVTMCVVMVRTGMKRSVGKLLDVLPTTMETAIVSPTARPTPRMRAERIPRFAAGTQTLKIACALVLPRASAPS